MSNFYIVHLGQYARDQFNLCPKGKVLAVFSNIIYLLNEYDEISWISSQQYPMHRRSIQIIGQIPKIDVGSKFIVDKQIIVIDSSVQLDMAEAKIWESPNLAPSKRQEIPIIQGQIQKVFQIILELPDPKGLGVLLSRLILQSIKRFQEVSIDTDNLFEPKYWAIINNIISAGMRSDLKQFKDEAIKIVGLGKGLTPSGDDFYGGLFFCLKYINENISKNFKLHGQIDVNQLKGMTNHISYAIMSDMVQGHGVEPLHQLLDSIFLGEGDEKKIKEYSSQLLSIGNSTGWDIMTGVVVGLLIYKNIKRKQPQAIEFEEILT